MKKQEIPIRTIQDVLNALQDPSDTVRMALLQAVSAQPDKAASLALKGKVDLFNELKHLSERPGEAIIRTYYINAMLSLDDERGFVLAKEEFLATKSSDIVLLTGKKLSVLPPAERIGFFGPVVCNGKDQNKRRVAANLLAHNEDLPTRLAIQVAVIADHPVALPALDRKNLAEWLAELQGRYPQQARKYLLSKNDDSFKNLLDNWDCLPLPIKRWAFVQAMQDDSGQHDWLVKKVLQHESEAELLVEALKNSEAVSRDICLQHLKHDVPEVRAAVIKYSEHELDYARMYVDESSIPVKVELLAAMADKVTAGHLQLIADQFDADHWKIRAAAVSAMGNMGTDAIPILEKLYVSDIAHVKAGAMQALARMNQIDQNSL